jgi:serine/threonine protein kinase
MSCIEELTMGNEKFDAFLVAALKDVKSHPMNFAFVGHSAKDGVLILSKTKIEPQKIDAAKKKFGGTAVHQGQCVHEAGKLVFELDKQPDATLATVLKEVIKRDTGEATQPIFRAQAPTAGGLSASAAEKSASSGGGPRAVVASAANKGLDMASSVRERLQSAGSRVANAVKSPAKQSPSGGQAAPPSGASTGNAPTSAPTSTSTQSTGHQPEYTTLQKDPSKAQQAASTAPVYTTMAKDPTKAQHPGVDYTTMQKDPTKSQQSGPEYTTMEKDPSKAAPVYTTMEKKPQPTAQSAPVYETMQKKPQAPQQQPNYDQLQKKDAQPAPQQTATQTPPLPVRPAPPPGPSGFSGRAPRNDEALIPSRWAQSINLANLDRCSVYVPDVNSKDALKGQNGQLGFIKSPDSNSPLVPPLIMKVALNPSSENDLQTEVDAYKRLADNPRFLKCLGMTSVGGRRGMVMEQVDGADMRKTLDSLKSDYKSGKVSHEQFWGTVQFTVRETLRGLQDLEKAGIVHHDIASDNLICDRKTGAVKIFDFGCWTEQKSQGGAKLPVGKGMVSPDVITTDSQGAPALDNEGITTKHDAFAAGAIAYEAGEGDKFRYHGPSDQTPNFNFLLAFKSLALDDTDPDQNAAKAIRPGDAANPASKRLPQQQENKQAGQFAGTATHVPGRSGASTAYTEFVNTLMHPDPSKRMSLAAALKHPFLSDSLLNDDQAKEFLKGVRPGAQKSS